MSKKSSTFAPFKVKIYIGNRMSCRKRAVFFYALPVVRKRI